MKGQASTEFLVIIAVMGTLLLPLLLIVQTSTFSSPEGLAVGKATLASSRLASAANSVGFLGAGSKMYVTLEMPNTRSIEIGGREIIFNIDTSYGPVQIVQPTNHPVKGLKIENIGDEGTYTFVVFSSETMPAEVTVELR